MIKLDEDDGLFSVFLLKATFALIRALHLHSLLKGAIPQYKNDGVTRTCKLCFLLQLKLRESYFLKNIFHLKHYNAACASLDLQNLHT